MKYDVELVNCGSNIAIAVKHIRTVLACDMTTAKYYVENVPSILLSDVDENMAISTRDSFMNAGLEVRLIEKEYITPTPIPQAPLTTVHGGTQNLEDRDLLVNLLIDYDRFNRETVKIDGQISEARKRETELGVAIKKLQTTIDRNKRIKDTGGNCARPAYNRRSVIGALGTGFRAFVIFPGVAIAFFVIMLILVAVTPETIENWAALVGLPDGVFFFLGVVAAALAVTLVCSVIWSIKELFEAISVNKYRARAHNNFDTKKALNEAIIALGNAVEERNKLDIELASVKKEIDQYNVAKSNIVPVQNNLRMQNELRSYEGVSLLIYYIDSGRASNLQEANNIYIQDKNNAEAMSLLREQTEYTHDMMVSARIAAENSERILEETRRQADAAERSADAAERSARANEFTSWAAASAADSLTRIERKF